MAKKEITFITPKEFEKRMTISRSTRFNWHNAEILIRDEHYLQIRKKVLYVWHEDLPRELAERAQKVKEKKQQNKQLHPSKRPCGPNWDF